MYKCSSQTLNVAWEIRNVLQCHFGTLSVGAILGVCYIWGKKTVMGAWLQYDFVTPVFAALSTAPAEISDEQLSLLKKFCVKLYDRNIVQQKMLMTSENTYLPKKTGLRRTFHRLKLPSKNTANVQLTKPGMFGARV
jgi:hypothetical protein